MADQLDLWLGRIVWDSSGGGLVLELWPEGLGASWPAAAPPEAPGEGLAVDLLAPLRTDLLESVSFDTEGVPAWFLLLKISRIFLR